MTDNIEDMVEDLKDLAILGNEQINYAKPIWKSYRSAILGSQDAFGGNGFKETADWYIGLQRLSSESLDIATYHQNSKTQKRTPHLMAIDAQLFDAYAQYRNPVALRGFDFFVDEWNDDRDGELRRNYLQSLLWKLFSSSNPKLLTQSTRGEISDASVFLLNQGKGKSTSTDGMFDYVGKRKESALGAAQELVELEKTMTAMASFSGIEPTAAQGFLHDKFEKICAIYAIPSTYQQFAAARYLDALRGANSLSPVNLGIANAGDAISKDQRALLQKLTSRFLRDGSLMTSAKSQLQKAFFEYKSSFENETDYKLSKGTNDNLDALLEVNIYNHAFKLIGVDLEIKYVTMNTQIASFLHGFVSGQMAIPLVHPRNVFFWESPNSFRKKSREFQKFAAYASSFSIRAVAHEDRIDNIELRSVRENLVPVCRDIQAFHSSLLDDEISSEDSDALTSPDYTRIIGAIDRYFADILTFFSDRELPERLGTEDLKLLIKGQQSISTLAKKLETLTAETRRSLVVDQLDDLLKVVEKLNADTQDPILVRGFSRNGSGQTKRLTCLPLRGQYRYLFAIHNTAVIKAFKANLDKPFKNNEPQIFSTSEFFRRIKHACELVEERGNIADRLKAKALRRFNSAYHSSAQGDWAMADLILSSMIEEFETNLNKRPASNFGEVFHLIMHEALFLQHMILRARAQLNASNKSRIGLLEESVLKLQRSANEMLLVPSETFHNGPTLAPLSLRIGLAQVATATEWLFSVLGSKSAGQRELSLIDGNGVHTDFSWSSEYGCPTSISTQNWQTDIKALKQYLEKVFRVYANSYVENLEEAEHEKYVIWDYLIRRISNIHDFLSIVEFTLSADRQNSQTRGDQFLVSREQKFLENLGREFRKTVNKLRKEGAPLNSVSNPLNDSIVDFVSLIKRLDRVKKNPDDVTSSDIGKILHTLDSLDRNCAALDESGMPRQVIRKAKSVCATEVISILKRHIDKLDKTYVNPVVVW